MPRYCTVVEYGTMVAKRLQNRVGVLHARKGRDESTSLAERAERLFAGRVEYAWHTHAIREIRERGQRGVILVLSRLAIRNQVVN
jgi:hypothetical protein